MDYLKILWASVLSVVVLFLLTKLMGNKQISQLNTFDYITGITIGSIAAEMATDLENHLLQNILAMVVYAIFTISISIATNKSLWARRFFSGDPVVLLEKGKLYKSRLKKAKMDVNEFLGIARLAGFFDLSQVETAVFEHNGDISFLPKSLYRPSNPNDVNLTPAEENLMTDFIIDGKIMGHALKACGRDMNWLKKQLEANEYKSEKEVFLLSADQDDNVVVFGMEK